MSSDKHRNDRDEQNRRVGSGDGTVNHGPGQDDGLFDGPEDPFGRPDSAGGPDSPDPLDSLGGDELALRRLLHEAVEEIEPKSGTLDHLRRAVPAGGPASGRPSSVWRPRPCSSARRSPRSSM